MYSLHHPFTKKPFMKAIPHGRGLLIEDVEKSKYPIMVKGGNFGTTNLILGTSRFKSTTDPQITNTDKVTPPLLENLHKFKPVIKGGKIKERNNIKLVI